MLKMITDFSLTPGTIMFLSGVALLITAVVLSVATAVGSGNRKRKISEKMKEIY